MKQKKKESLTWRATKAIFRGTGKAISGTYGFLSRKVQESKEKSRITSNPSYNLKPSYNPLTIHKELSGDYSSFTQRLEEESIIALIFGKRGSGKSALGFRILENAHANTKRPCFVLGVPAEVLPKWIKPIEHIDHAETGSIILIDEGALSFNSRESMKLDNKTVSKLMAIARHKGLTLLFITQNTGMLDKNVLKLADVLLIKEGSLLQLEMERQEIKKFYIKAKELFEDVEGDKRQYAYLIDSDFEGVIGYKLPSFWRTELSKNKSNQ